MGGLQITKFKMQTSEMGNISLALSPENISTGFTTRHLRSYFCPAHMRGSRFFSDNVFSLMRGERIQILLKAGHHRPVSEMPLNGVLLAGQ